MIFKEFIEIFTEDMDEDIQDLEFVAKAKRLINRGYKELCKKELLEKVIDTTAIDREITRPYDYFKVLEVRQDNRALPFKLEGKRIVIPTDGDIKLFYAYFPEPLQDPDDEPLTNPANDEFILNYAKYLYLMTEEELDRAQLYKRECDDFNIFKKARVQKIIDVYNIGMW